VIFFNEMYSNDTKTRITLSIFSFIWYGYRF